VSLLKQIFCQHDYRLKSKSIESKLLDDFPFVPQPTYYYAKRWYVCTKCGKRKVQKMGLKKSPHILDYKEFGTKINEP